MYSEVILIHRPGGQGRSTLIDDLRKALESEGHWSESHRADDIFAWQTCLRQIVLMDEGLLDSIRPALLRGDEIYHGDVAYRFLLEVICGLHSPLIGETEVYGQFKNTVASQKTPSSPWGARLNRIFRSLFEDAKQIRQEYLEDLGSQSYGSVLRRDLKNVKRIHIIGAGQLVQEILPWIMGLEHDVRDVHVYARDVAKATEALPLPFRSFVKVHELNENEAAADAEALIIAAPVDSSFVGEWSSNLKSLKLAVDLRADSATDRILTSRSSVRTIDLNEVFRRIADNQAVLEERKSAALRSVSEATASRGGFVENRPFGWEDVCA